jgi:hypothetical protein
MVAVAAGLMAPLGWWVSEKAERATEVALNEIDGIRCPELLSVTPAATAPAGEDVVEEDLLAEPEESAEEAKELEEAPPVETEEGDQPAAPEEGDEGEDTKGEDAEEEEERPRAEIKVNIDDSEMPEVPVVVVGEMKETPPTPAEIAERKTLRANCLEHIENRKSSVRERKTLIRTVMIVSGVMLLLFLCLYGIKTTHRVAGPLFKVGLYLGKLKNNVYDTVYNLRKGDQLVEFYDHFKEAHAGATKMQEEDRDRLKDAIALAKDAGLAEKDPEIARLVTELEAMLEEKEKSLEA